MLDWQKVTEDSPAGDHNSKAVLTFYRAPNGSEYFDIAPQPTVRCRPERYHYWALLTPPEDQLATPAE